MDRNEECYVCQTRINIEEDSHFTVNKAKGTIIKYMDTMYFCSNDCLNRRVNIKESSEGIIVKSETSGKTYRVFRWEDLGNGKIVSINKVEI